MLVKRFSVLDNQEHSMELPVTMEQFADGFCRQDGGMAAQEAHPNLNLDQIYFLGSGITPEIMQKEMEQ